jgi:hypothetical protein
MKIKTTQGNATAPFKCGLGLEKQFLNMTNKEYTSYSPIT